MRLAHDAQPLVGRRLGVAVQQPAHAIDQNLRAAAGNAVEPGRDQPIDDRGRRYPVEPRDMQDFRRRESMQLELRVTRLDRAEEILIPLNRKIRVVAALQQELVSTDRNRLVDLVEDLLEPEHVPLAVPDLAIERAEVAARHADVRVIDVAVDDVVTTRSGCFRARMPSASEPSRCVGAWRYSSSASAASTRPPSRTLLAI